MALVILMPTSARFMTSNIYVYAQNNSFGPKNFIYKTNDKCEQIVHAPRLFQELIYIRMDILSYVSLQNSDSAQQQ